MTTILNVKIDQQVKNQAHKVAEQLGLTLSGVVNVYLRELIRTKTINVSAQEEIPSARLLAAIKSGEDDLKKGRALSFDTPKKAIDFLDKLIAKNSKKK